MRLWGKFLNTEEQKLSVFSLLMKNFGINLSLALKCCSLLGVSPQLKFMQLSIDKKSKLDALIFLLIRNYNLVLYKDLERLRSLYIVKFLKIGNYKSFRFRQNLPMRGQRTHSNAGTQKRVFSKLISARLRNFFFSRQMTSSSSQNIKRDTTRGKVKKK